MSHKKSWAGARRSRDGSSLFFEELRSNAGFRQERHEQVLFDEVARLVRDEASDPAFDGVRIVSLDLSADGSHARFAYVARGPLSSEKRIARTTHQAFTRAASFFRARLAAVLDAKRIPTLGFVLVGIEDGSLGEPPGGGEAWHD